MVNFVAIVAIKFLIGENQATEESELLYAMLLVITYPIDSYMYILFAYCITNMYKVYSMHQIVDQDKLYINLLKIDRLWRVFLFFKAVQMVYCFVVYCYLDFWKRGDVVDMDKVLLISSFIVTAVGAVIDLIFFGLALQILTSYFKIYNHSKTHLVLLYLLNFIIYSLLILGDVVKDVITPLEFS